MNPRLLADWVRQSLACPDCQSPLLPGEQRTFECACGFRAEPGSPPDLRPRNPRPRRLEVVPGTKAWDILGEIPLTRPQLTVRSAPEARDSSELFSAIQPGIRPGGRLLDLGCGPRDQESTAVSLGLRYCGVDYQSAAADLLVDAHTLPFSADTFDIVFSYAVLEHLYSPPLALAEVWRVLAPGGIYVGTVSQGEPFHDSFFHHTSWGLLHGLSSSGFKTERIWPASDTLRALASMGRYPRIGRSMIAGVDLILRTFPILAPRKQFRWTERERQLDALHRTSAICFVATKPLDRP